MDLSDVDKTHSLFGKETKTIGNNNSLFATTYPQVHLQRLREQTRSLLQQGSGVAPEKKLKIYECSNLFDPSETFLGLQNCFDTPSKFSSPPPKGI